MAKFCKYCGNPLIEGKPCSCSKSRTSRSQTNKQLLLSEAGAYSPRHKKTDFEQFAFPTDNKDDSYSEDMFSDEAFYNSYKQESAPSDAEDEYDDDADFFEKIKNRIGIGSPELNHGDPFKLNERIVPDSIEACEGEIPVKQYILAKLRSRIMGIPYTKAMGRMQVTNKRLIFRASGKCIAGRTTLQQEFSISEIAGIEARREYVFNAWDLFAALITTAVGIAITVLLFGVGFPNIFGGYYDVGPTVFYVLLPIAVSVGCYFIFFKVYRRWLLKILCFGSGLGSFISSIYILYDIDEGITIFFSEIFIVVALIIFILLLFLIFVYCVRPNLALAVKTKSSFEALDVKRRRTRIFALNSEDHTGYTEVIPEEDAEIFIREVGAIITDIQQLGDLAIDMWRNDK